MNMGTTPKTITTETEIDHQVLTNVDGDPLNSVTNVTTALAQPEQKNFTAAEVEGLLATNQRLLNESKRNKERRKVAEERTLLAEGKKDELITSLKSQIEESRQEKREYAIMQALAEEGQKRNCPDWDFMYNSTDSNIDFDFETGKVSGVGEYFDTCESNERLKKRFFERPAQIVTNNSTPTTNNNGPKFDYRIQPVEYLMDIKKTQPEKYNTEVLRMQREGLIG